MDAAGEKVAWSPDRRSVSVVRVNAELRRQSEDHWHNDSQWLWALDLDDTGRILVMYWIDVKPTPAWRDELPELHTSGGPIPKLTGFGDPIPADIRADVRFLQAQLRHRIDAQRVVALNGGVVYEARDGSLHALAPSGDTTQLSPPNCHAQLQVAGRRDLVFGCDSSAGFVASSTAGPLHWWRGDTRREIPGSSWWGVVSLPIDSPVNDAAELTIATDDGTFLLGDGEARHLSPHQAVHRHGDMVVAEESEECAAFVRVSDDEIMGRVSAMHYELHEQSWEEGGPHIKSWGRIKGRGAYVLVGETLFDLEREVAYNATVRGRRLRMTTDGRFLVRDKGDGFRWSRPRRRPRPMTRAFDDCATGPASDS